MKKHPFLEIDFLSTVKLTQAQSLQIKKHLILASTVMKSFFKVSTPLANKEKFNTVRISLMVCGDSRMRALNLSSRGKNKITDVLSFPHHENLRKNKNHISLDKNLYLGELAICHPQAQRQAKKFGVRYSDEFIHLFFHGILHLVGFDHEISAKEEKLMQELEDHLLEEFSKLKRSKKKGS